MATPTSLPASFTSGAVLTAAQMNDLRGAFRILQIVQGTIASVATNSTGTYADTGLTASITPQDANNKILVLVTQSTYNGASGLGCGIRLLRGASVLQTHTDAIYGGTSAVLGSVTIMALDAPATTSSTTYKTQFARTAGASGTVYVQGNNNQSTIILCEVSA